MTSKEIKAKAEQMALKAAEFLNNNILDEKELNHRYLELACSFLTLACSPDKDLKGIEEELRYYSKEMYKMALVEMIKYKTGDEVRVVKEIIHRRAADDKQ